MVRLDAVVEVVAFLLEITVNSIRSQVETRTKNRILNADFQGKQASWYFDVVQYTFLSPRFFLM